MRAGLIHTYHRRLTEVKKTETISRTGLGLAGARKGDIGIVCAARAPLKLGLGNMRLTTDRS